jgi:hypothetical protein
MDHRFHTSHCTDHDNKQAAQASEKPASPQGVNIPWHAAGFVVSIFRQEEQI